MQVHAARRAIVQSTRVHLTSYIDRISCNLYTYNVLSTDYLEQLPRCARSGAGRTYPFGLLVDTLCRMSCSCNSKVTLETDVTLYIVGGCLFFIQCMSLLSFQAHLSMVRAPLSVGVLAIRSRDLYLLSKKVMVTIRTPITRLGPPDIQ